MGWYNTGMPEQQTLVPVEERTPEECPDESGRVRLRAFWQVYIY